MAWDFLYIVRRNYQGDNNWGDMYIKTKDNKWEWLSYTYELPWKPDGTGKSTSNQSRIKIGSYNLIVRTDGKAREAGGKGWRLELQGTGHRQYIQVHRAHSSMFIQGCILPVHFKNISSSTIQVGNIQIQNKSIELMEKIEARYKELVKIKKGNPALVIAAKLPPNQITNRSHAYA